MDCILYYSRVNHCPESDKWEKVESVFLPAMPVHWVYEGFHCVLDLISNILYSL